MEVLCGLQVQLLRAVSVSFLAMEAEATTNLCRCPPWTGSLLTPKIHWIAKVGPSPAEATTLQQEKLSAADETLESLASDAMNPSAMTVRQTAWRQQPYGQPVDPILSWVIRPNYLQHTLNIMKRFLQRSRTSSS
ncbi:hypothetical protein ISCGN_007766 [Ixodes scapularis]